MQQAPTDGHDEANAQDRLAQFHPAIKALSKLKTMEQTFQNDIGSRACLYFIILSGFYATRKVCTVNGGICLNAL